ncbi:MAG: helix-hairpin-helix domain-containing protein [Candidatus Binatia bacterium]|nr:helix-hairpin-helix domain-containing protein [Candidatus Binatia bacterium]
MMERKSYRQRLVGGALIALLLCSCAMPGWAAETKPINVNTATMAELMSIKGIGEAKARAIIEHREKHGPFKTVDELKNVTGIGDKLLATLRPQVTVGEPALPAPGAAPATK